jgi:hypothetical protein
MIGDNNINTHQSESGIPLATSTGQAATNQMRKFSFTSKFNKFNCSCILDLIDEKDLNELNLILSKIDANNMNNFEQTQLQNDIKIFLRFNWYSFNDLNVTNPTGLFPNQQNNNLNYISTTTTLPSMSKQSQSQLSKSSLLFTHHTNVQQNQNQQHQQNQQQQQQQQQNLPFVRHNDTSTSSSSMLFMGNSSGKAPTPNSSSTLSTHSSSSTVYNQQATSTSIQSLNSNKRQG